VWLARQSPLRGSAEFCRPARRINEKMVPRVAGIPIYPWPGIDNAPNPLAESSITLIAGLPGPSGKTTCIKALAQEYAMALSAPSDGTATANTSVMVRTIGTDGGIIVPRTLQSHVDLWIPRVSRLVMASCKNTYLDRLMCGVDGSDAGMLEVSRVVRGTPGVHLVFAACITNDIADLRIWSEVDRVVIVTGPTIALGRARLARRVGAILGVDEQETLYPFIASLPAYTQLVIERRPGCARDAPPHYSNMVILVKPPA